MEPKNVGRTLGIGVRVASKMVQERIAAAAAQPPQNAAQPAPKAGFSTDGRPTMVRPPTRSGNRHNLSLMEALQRGLRAFFRAFLGPFTHAGGILWLEITGLFFALFTFFFLQSVYRVRNSWRGGPDHTHLLLYVALAAGFGWFSASSFLRAHRRSKRGPSR